MAQDITLLNVDYPSVPSVLLPKTGGGTASFIDTTIAQDAASAGDIAQGKQAYVNSNLITGTLMPIEKQFTRTVSDFLTVPSGVNVDGSCTTYGEMVELYLKVTPTSSHNAKWLCGTLKHDYIPIDYSYGVEWITGAAVEAGTDGRIRMNGSVSANTNYFMSFVFVKKY